MISVNEKSPLFMTIAFKDEIGDPLIPTSVEWRLDDKTNGTEVVAWTTIPGPASIMNFTIPSDNNAIEDETNVRETQIFGIRVDEGGPGEGHEEFEYSVINLTGPIGP